MSTSHTGKREEIDVLLGQDDADAVVAMIKDDNLYFKQAAFAQALAHDPWPTNSLEALFKAGTTYSLYPGGWLVLAAKTNWSIDWTRTLHWLEPRVGQKPLRKNVAQAWHQLADDFTSQTIRTDARQGVERALVGLLDYWPELGREVMENSHKTKEMLFFLSTHPSKTDWLRRGRIPLEDVILAGTRTAKVLNFYEPREDGTTGLDDWLDNHPKRQLAWERAVLQDRQLVELERKWRERWLPDGIWPNSPLYHWCRDISQPGPGGATSPLDDPLFDIPGLQRERMSNPAEIAKTYSAKAVSNALTGSAAARSSGLLSFTEQRLVHDQIRTRLAVDMHDRYLLKPVPLHPLADGLDHNQEWACRAGGTQEGARTIQSLLEDPRVERLLNRIDGRTIAQWIVQEPSWRMWRHTNGKSVLDLRIDIEADLGRGIAIPKATLLKVARAAPELLMTPTTEGCALDRLNIKDMTRADIRRTILKREVERGQRINPKGRRTL